VRLPYHKPKQKSLKDFLNRQKLSNEYQASLTGSKKLLHKAWQVKLKILNLINNRYLKCNFDIVFKLMAISIKTHTPYNILFRYKPFFKTISH